MTDHTLSFRNVSFGYHSAHQLLKNMTFELRRGHITAILGPNGAGKTTLLSLALGWRAAQSGEILLAGIPLHTLSARDRGRRMALVPQAEQTPFHYSVLEYVLLGRAPHLPPLATPTRADSEIAQSALGTVGISALANRPVPQLSGGERRLVLLARALTQLVPAARSTGEPAGGLLLLDEPAAHLDLAHKSRLIAIMRQLRDAGTTLLMTSHEPEVVLATADDVLLMEAAAPSQFGPLKDIFTAEALSRVYHLPIRLVTVDGRPQVLWT
jgi:iron complex transport system ATP-binding protein